MFILLAFYAFTLIYAMGWAVLSSLKTQMEFSTNLVGLPKEWKFDNLPAGVPLGAGRRSQYV